MSLPEEENGDQTSTEITERLIREVRPFLQPNKLKEAEHQIEALVIQELRQEFHQGPLPTPRYLVQYEQALPGAAERIVSMAEAEQKHRHKCENRLVGGEVTLKFIGQALAFVSLILMMVLIGYMTWLGHAKAAATLGAVMVTGVVGLFLAPRFFHRPEVAAAPPKSNRGKKRR